MTPLDVLATARERIRTSDRWVKDISRRHALEFPHQLQYCLLGAISDPLHEVTAEDGAASYIRRTLYNTEWRGGAMNPRDISIVSFNDLSSRTHDQVLKVLDAAIQLAEAEQEKE